MVGIISSEKIYWLINSLDSEGLVSASRTKHVGEIERLKVVNRKCEMKNSKTVIR